MDVYMLSGLVKAITLTSVLSIISGCGAGGDESESPVNSISDSIISPRMIQNEQCPNGGVEIQLGIDANANGRLDPDEIDHTRTQTVCHGSDGVNGSDGTSGTDGSNSLVFIEDSIEGECEHGGQTVTIGLDSNQNGVLDQGESAQSQTICNVVSGVDGIDSLVDTNEEPSGENCAAGGLKIDSGLDGNANNILDEGEIQSTSYICHGVDGQDGESVDLSELLIETINEPNGANCLHGGGKHQIGLDTNDNGELEAEEILSASYSCNDNSPPTIHFTHDGQVIAGTQYTVELIGQDEYGDDVALNIVNKPVWLTETRLANHRIQLSGLAPSEIDQSFIIEASATDSDLTANAQLGLNTIGGILLSATAESVTEGNSGTQAGTFNVQLSTAATEVLQVHYNLLSVTSKQGQDWQAEDYSGVLVFSEGETAKQISLEILADQRFELDEAIGLKIQSIDYAGNELVQVASYTLLHIINDDQLVIHADQENSVPVFNAYGVELTDVALSNQPAWMATAAQWQYGQSITLKGSPSVEDIGTQGLVDLSIASSNNDGVITSTTYHVEYTISEGDRDGDGVVNSQDAFPDNASAQTDSDNDGLGDEWEISQFENLALANNTSDFDDNGVTDLSAFHNSSPVNDISFSFESGALPSGWINTGDVDWIVSNDKSYHGDYALTLAQQLEPGQVARVNFEVTTQSGMASLFSKREVDTPLNFELHIWVDDSLIRIDENPVYWKRSTIPFTAGKHQVRIELSNYREVGVVPLVYMDHISGLRGIVPGDRDGDGVANAADIFPDRADAATDTDNDGIGDEWEMKNCPDALYSPYLCDVELGLLDSYSAEGDFDKDGLADINEFLAGTLPYDTDSDNDGPYPDYYEQECRVGNLPPEYCNDDSVDLFPADNRYRDDVDGDGLADKWELRHFANLDASDGSQDSDGDSLTDAQEFVLDSMPAVDTDSDGVADAVDAFPNDSRYALDADNDGIADEWENSHGGIHMFTAEGDYDQDQRTDFNEFIFETNPTVIDVNAATDTDNDGLGDEWEMANFGNLNVANATSDFDGNGVTDLSAFQNNTVVDDGRVAPLFDVLSGVIPYGSDLIFADAPTTDGTSETNLAGTASQNAVTDAIDDLDAGISTLSPIDIPMDGSVDPASVVAGGNVFLVRLPNAASIAEFDLILPTGLDATSVDALDFSSIAPFFATTKADGTAASDAAFAAGTGLPESVAALNLFGMNDGVLDAGDGILAMQPAAADYTVSVIGLDDGTNNTIRISPTKPLASTTKYIVVVTGSVKASDGRDIIPSLNYASIRGTDPLVSAALAPIRSLLQGAELMASTIITSGGTNLAPMAKGIAYSFTHTTGDPDMVLKSMAAPGYWAPSVITNNTIADAVIAAGGIDPAGVADQAKISTAISVADAVLTTANPALGNATAYSHPRERAFELIKNAGGAGVHQIPVASLTAGLIANNVLISQGAIELPQYTQSLTVGASQLWSANTLVGAVLDSAFGQAVGTTPPKDKDGTNNVTYRYPFAQEQRTIVTPLFFIEPIADSLATLMAANDGNGATSAADYRSIGPAGTGCGEKPANGWPVIIMQHGFQGDRAGNALNGSNIVDRTCHAVVAMDLPHHGISATSSLLSPMGVDYVEAGSEAFYPFAAAKAAIVAATAANSTILDSLAERHENFYLNSATGTVAAMDFGETKVGDSGSLYIRLDVLQRTRDNLRQGAMDQMNLNATLSIMDINGDDQPDFDVSNVSYIGHSLGGISGTTFVAVNNDATVQQYNGKTNGGNLPLIQRAILATPGGHLTKMFESSAALGPSLIGGLSVALGTGQGTTTMASYLKTAQATDDSGDPMNFISDLATGGSSATPTLIIEMVGDGTAGNMKDTVVPTNGLGPLPDGTALPASAVSPLVGADPMIALLGAENVVDSPAGNKLVAKYNSGDHGTFSSASSLQVFAEMLSQTIQFILTSDVTTVADSTVLVSDVAE